jgi:hypothetical protein
MFVVYFFVDLRVLVVKAVRPEKRILKDDAIRRWIIFIRPLWQQSETRRDW